MKARIVIFLGILLLGGMPLFASGTIMKIPGHDAWIDVISFRWRGAHELWFTKKTDKASPMLMSAAASSKHFPSVTLESYGGRYELQDVTITSDQRSAMRDGSVRETITMSFARGPLHDPVPPRALPAVQTPNATLNGGLVTLKSLKLVGQTQAIIVVCDAAALQRASLSRQPIPSLSIHAGQKAFTFTNVLVSSYSAAAGGCNQATLNFARYDGPAGGY